MIIQILPYTGGGFMATTKVAEVDMDRIDSAAIVFALIMIAWQLARIASAIGKNGRQP